MKLAKAEKPIVEKKRKVNFRVPAAAGSHVFVAGSFNNWDPRATPLKEGIRGFSTAISLSPGRYEYKFVINGEWVIDPDNADTVENGCGTLNSVITL